MVKKSSFVLPYSLSSSLFDFWTKNRDWLGLGSMKWTQCHSLMQCLLLFTYITQYATRPFCHPIDMADVCINGIFVYTTRCTVYVKVRYPAPSVLCKSLDMSKFMQWVLTSVVHVTKSAVMPLLQNLFHFFSPLLNIVHENMALM